ncbi:hypothetical protein PLICRDRAFT_408471 [Plicaturopsis crispa FD-325 SS-3]|nr:hypothetical protein PLICRDRAFT_408471 [Plicaturopsis crispa FD-325 SS-3]
MAPTIFRNAVASVTKPPTLLMLLGEEQTGWCRQFSEEGYSVIHVVYPPAPETSFQESLKDAEKEIFNLGADWSLITYGLRSKDARTLLSLFALSLADLKACVHYCPVSQSGKGFLVRDGEMKYYPTVFHLSSKQEDLHASLLPLNDTEALEHDPKTSSYPPLSVFTYPLVPEYPPFPFLTKAPALIKEGDGAEVDPHILSANNLAHSRTLAVLKRNLGPHYDLEKLWEAHTYFEFVERDAPKTMSTMVPSPYVNHVPTMTGGVGYTDLARFYKHHFTNDKVTPPDTEIITVSRTVGADRVVDEMIFKCTHTTEIDYFLPGVAPTGKPLSIAMVGVIAFRGDKLCFEHLYWDQASVLVQIGLLEATNLPIAGVETTQKVLNPYSRPSNTLLARWTTSEGSCNAA